MVILFFFSFFLLFRARTCCRVKNLYKKKNSKTKIDEEQALIQSQAINNEHLTNANARTTTVPTTTTTTTLAASKTKNCRGLIQKRAHTLDDFMEGNI